jgi:hypothetical protein
MGPFGFSTCFKFALLSDLGQSLVFCLSFKSWLFSHGFSLTLRRYEWSPCEFQLNASKIGLRGYYKARYEPRIVVSK